MINCILLSAGEHIDSDEISMHSSGGNDSDNSDIDMSQLLKDCRTSKKRSTSIALSPVKEDHAKSQRLQDETCMLFSTFWFGIH